MFIHLVNFIRIYRQNILADENKNNMRQAQKENNVLLTK